MGAQVSHEPFFCLLREVVSYGKGGKGQPSREVLDNPCADSFVLLHIECVSPCCLGHPELVCLLAQVPVTLTELCLSYCCPKMAAIPVATGSHAFADASKCGACKTVHQQEVQNGARPKPWRMAMCRLLREYFGLEFGNLQLPFPVDVERIIDDFVLFCMFTGNDFLPRAPQRCPWTHGSAQLIVLDRASAHTSSWQGHSLQAHVDTGLIAAQLPAGQGSSHAV